MPSKQKISFHTLGCKLNYAETSTIESLFDKNRYDKVPFSEKADIYVINTCSVTEQANKKCRQTINRAIRTSPGAKVVVVGCFAQLKAEEIAQIPGVSLVLGTKEKFNIVTYLESGTSPLVEEKIHSCEIDEVTQYAGSFSTEGRTRSFLKVQDGCDYNCSYCTIPLARGKSRNPRIEEVISQAQTIASNGIKEIILTGVNIGDFGRSTGESFFDLIKALDAHTPIERFRISSIEPNLLTDQMIEWIARSERFMPHFHIPLQSGSDYVLKLMRRRYNTNMFREKIATIKNHILNAGIGIDVIVGTPGELPHHFDECFSFLQEIDFSYLHVFSYSPRENTDALAIEPKVKEQIKTNRSKLLHELSHCKSLDFARKNMGLTTQVLFEQRNEKGFITGYTPQYMKVTYPFDKNLVNTIQTITITGVDENATVSCTIL